MGFFEAVFRFAVLDPVCFLLGVVLIVAYVYATIRIVAILKQKNPLLRRDHCIGAALTIWAIALYAGVNYHLGQWLIAESVFIGSVIALAAAEIKCRGERSVLNGWAQHIDWAQLRHAILHAR